MNAVEEWGIVLYVDSGKVILVNFNGYLCLSLDCPDPACFRWQILDLWVSLN